MKKALTPLLLASLLSVPAFANESASEGSHQQHHASESTLATASNKPMKMMHDMQNHKQMMGEKHQMMSDHDCTKMMEEMKVGNVSS